MKSKKILRDFAKNKETAAEKTVDYVVTRLQRPANSAYIPDVSSKEMHQLMVAFKTNVAQLPQEKAQHYVDQIKQEPRRFHNRLVQTVSRLKR